MKILAVECSAAPASAAILDGRRVVASVYTHVKMTHSQTLMPMIDGMLKAARIRPDELEGYAVSAGPGSFTGVRIGISAVKGMAAPRGLPCVGVSTLYAMAQNYSDTDCIVCAVMDARCGQVYNALFSVENGKITRLCEDRALLCVELAEEVKKLSQNGEKRVIIVGDGADLFAPTVTSLARVAKADPQRQFQHAVGVGTAALALFEAGQTVSPDRLLPVYLRLPQAERELKKKEGNA